MSALTDNSHQVHRLLSTSSHVSLNDWFASSVVMTLNLLKVSPAFNLFVARQFKVCVRYSLESIHLRHHKPALTLDFTGCPAFFLPGARWTTYHHSFSGFPPLSRNFNNNMVIPNPNNSQARAAHTGNKSYSSNDFPPLVTKSTTNKSNLDFPGKKSFSKEKVKICRPRIVSSSSTNLHSDFKMQKMIKLLREQKYKATISRNKQSEMVNRFRDSDKQKNWTEQNNTINTKTNQLITMQDRNGIGREIQSNKSGQLVKSQAKWPFKNVDDKNLGIARINEDLLKLIANTAKDIVKWLDTARKHMTKLEQAEGVLKTTVSRKISRPLNGKSLQQKFARKDDISNPSLNSSLTKTNNFLKTSANKSQVLTGNDKIAKSFKSAPIMSSIIQDLDKINQDISRLKRERNAEKDSTRLPRDKPSDKSKKSEELLEIRPTYIQNIDPGVDVVISKNTDLTKLDTNPSTIVEAQAMSKVKKGKITKDSQLEKGFILVDKASAEVVGNRCQPKLESRTKKNEKKNLTVDTECAHGKTTPTSVTCSGKERCAMAKSGGKCENLVRKSKQANLVLANDNPVYNLIVSEANNMDNKTNNVMVYQDCVSDVSKRDTIEKCNPGLEEMHGCTTFCSIKQKYGHKQTSTPNESQRVGSSDSSDELHQSLKSSNISRDRSPVLDALGSKGHSANTAISGNKELQKYTMLEEKLEGKPLGNSWTLSEIKEHQNAALVNGDDSQLKGSSHGIIARVKSKRGTSDADAEKEMEERLKNQLESAMEMRNVKAKGSKISNMSVNSIIHEKPKTVANDAPVKSTKGQKKGSSRKSNVYVPDKTDSKGYVPDKTDSKGYILKTMKSPAAVTELKPDFRQNKKDKSSQHYGDRVVKCQSEPKLCVKPEEVSKTIKQSGKSIAPKLVTPPLATFNIRPVGPLALGLNSNSPKSSLFSTDQEQHREMYKLDRPVTDTGTSEKSAIREIDNTLLTGTDGKEQYEKLTQKKSTPLSELFRKMNQSNKATAVISSKTTRQFPNRDRNNMKNMLTKKELIRTLQEQWSKDFQDKYNNLQQRGMYSPFLQSNTNCLVATSQDCNTSSGNQRDTHGTQPAPDSNTINTSSVSSAGHLVPKKINNFPTMGMSQRLLLASKNSLDALETGNAPTEFTFSDSSLNTDVPTQGSVEVEEFPEVDQFEEWIQNNMPEVYRDKTIKTSIGTYIEPPSRHGTPDSFKTPTKDTSRSPSVYEGSDVDGPSPLMMANTYSNPYANAEAVFEKKPPINSSFDEKRPNAELENVICNTCIGTMPHVNAYSNDSYRFGPPSVTDSATRKESFTGTITQQKSHSSNREHSETDILPSTGMRDTRSISDKEDLSSTLNISNTQNIRADSKSKNEKIPKHVSSMDGFVSMTLVQEPAENTLKSTLKRSKSRDRSEEKRVSFMNRSSKNDNCQTEYATGRSNEKTHELFNSSVDNLSPESNFVGDQMSGGSDIRKDLAEKRKRSEMEARIKLIKKHAKQIRGYEAVLFKYRDIIGEIKDNSKGVVKDKDTHPETRDKDTHPQTRDKDTHPQTTPKV